MCMKMFSLIVATSPFVYQLGDNLSKSSEINLSLPAVLGRGPLLRCANKKISRKHGILDFDDKGVLLTSTNENPFYCVINGVEKTICEGQSVVLSHGDTFGLLKTEYWFKINCVGSCESVMEDNALKNLQQNEDVSPCMQSNICKEIDNVVNLNDVNEDGDISKNENSYLLNSALICNHNKNNSKNDESSSSYSISRERKLPSWFSDAVSSKEDVYSKLAAVVPAKKPVLSHGKKIKIKKQSNLKTYSAPKGYSYNEALNEKVEEVTRECTDNLVKSDKKLTSHCVSEDEEKTSDTIAAYSCYLMNNNEESHSASTSKFEDATLLKENNEKSEPILPSTGKMLKETIPSISEADHQEDDKLSNSKKAKVRERCPYGSQCYRKNPVHKVEMSHPGENDYYSSSEDEGKPECEFGTVCYRKNPDHWKKFKHNRLPQPQRKAKRKARKQREKKEEGDESDDYDYDDPFINDNSSDDYAPIESDSDSSFKMSDDEEDHHEKKSMLKEAKAFLKKK